MTREIIFAWTQTVIAVLVVVGSGLLLWRTDIDPAVLVGVASMVIGYFFGQSVAPAPFYKPERVDEE